VSHNPGGGPVIPRVSLVLTGPVGPSVPHVRSTGNASGAGWPGPGQDAAGLVFANLGIALALHGRRALRARALNLASVGASVFMNAIAAAPGWRNLAIWILPPAAYALASDTLIGVVRTRALARHLQPGTALVAD